MSSGQIVSLACKPYLKEFFIHNYGAEPIKATRATKIFSLIAPLLSKKPLNWRPPVKSEGTLLIELPFSRIINVRCYCYLTKEHQAEIGTYIYGLFWHSFIRYMNEKVIQERWQVKYAIVNFIDQNGMSWDKTNYDTLNKIFYRYRVQENVNLSIRGEEDRPSSHRKSPRINFQYPTYAENFNL